MSAVRLGIGCVRVVSLVAVGLGVTACCVPGASGPPAPPPAPPPPPLSPLTQVVIPFEQIGQSAAGTFLRYRAGACEFVVRLPPEAGHVSGHQVSTRQVRVAGRELAMVRYQSVLSPPPMQPGQPTYDDAVFHPFSDVLTIGRTEILFPRTPPRACSDEDVARVLAALELR